MLYSCLDNLEDQAGILRQIDRACEAANLPHRGCSDDIKMSNIIG